MRQTTDNSRDLKVNEPRYASAFIKKQNLLAHETPLKMESQPQVESIARPQVESIARPQVESIARPQVESIARVESMVSAADSELDVEKKPIHISIRLIGDKGVGKSLIIDTYLGKRTKPEDEQNSTTENAGTDTAIDQGEYAIIIMH